MMEPFDIKNSCRTCLKSDCPLRSIYEIAVEEQSFANILELITAQTSHEILSGLSEKICFRCQENAILYYEFHETVVSSQNKVFDIIKEFNFASEIIEEEFVEEQDLNDDSEFAAEIIQEDDLYSDGEFQGHDNQEIYCCEICKSSFENEIELKNHCRLHTSTHQSAENRSILKPKKPKPMQDDSGRFICEICKRSYTTRHILNHHLRTHSRSKDFVCNYCPREFYFEKDLKVHIKQSHLDRKRYDCNECSSDFASSSALKKHMQTHTNTPNIFSCDKCNFTFKSKGTLKVHKRTHTGLKPFVCSKCPQLKAFAQKILLQRHMKTAHNENIYKCDWCDYSFEKNGELREHYRDCERFQNRYEMQEEFSIEYENQDETAVRSIEIISNED